MNRNTLREQRFIEEYLVDFNGTQAAIRAGYSRKAARVQAVRLLTRDNVRAEIERRMRELSVQAQERQAVNQDRRERIRQELDRIAFADIRNAVRWGPDGVELLPSDTLSDGVAAAVAEVSETVTQGGGSKRIKFHNKLDALEKLGRDIGMFKGEAGDSEGGSAGTARKKIIIGDLVVEF